MKLYENNKILKIFIKIFILSIFLGGCAQSSKCSTYNVNYVNWGNGTGMQPVFTPNRSYRLCE